MPRGTEVMSSPVGPERAPCRFQTAQDVRLHPLSLQSLELRYDPDETSRAPPRVRAPQGRDAGVPRPPPPPAVPPRRGLGRLDGAPPPHAPRDAAGGARRHGPLRAAGRRRRTRGRRPWAGRRAARRARPGRGAAPTWRRAAVRPEAPAGDAPVPPQVLAGRPPRPRRARRGGAGGRGVRRRPRVRPAVPGGPPAQGRARGAPLHAGRQPVRARRRAGQGRAHLGRAARDPEPPPPPVDRALRRDERREHRGGDGPAADLRPRVRPVGGRRAVVRRAPAARARGAAHDLYLLLASPELDAGTPTPETLSVVAPLHERVAALRGAPAGHGGPARAERAADREREEPRPAVAHAAAPARPPARPALGAPRAAGRSATAPSPRTTPSWGSWSCTTGPTPRPVGAAAVGSRR